MSKFKYVAAAAVASVMLSACDTETSINTVDEVPAALTYSLRSQLVGGASGVCSSAGQSSCENWSVWAAENLTTEQLANMAVAVTEPIELTEAKIAALVADPSWAGDSDFQTGVELILNYLREGLIDEGVNPPEYEDWSDFRAAFIAVKNEDIAELPEDIDGDIIWFDSTSAQYATFESLKKADERLNYTVTDAKVLAAKALLASLPVGSLDEDQLVIDYVLDELVSEVTRNQDELLAAIRAVELEGNVIADGAIWRSMDEDDWYDILLFETSTAENKTKPYKGPVDQEYQINQTIINLIESADWWIESEGAETVAILQYLLDQSGDDVLTYSDRDDFRDAFESVLISEGFENGGQVWNSLASDMRFRLMEILVDDLPNYNRAIEYVSIADTKNKNSVAVIEDFIAQAKLAGNTDTPHILVMTSSAANSYEAADYYVGMFTHNGATAEWLPLDRAYRKARDANQCDWLSAYHSSYSSAAHLDLLYPDYYQAHLDACENGLADLIASADGIFINGGDQVRTFNALVTFEEGVRVESAELIQIQARQAAGELVIGGTSAGAAVQSGGLSSNGEQHPMITAGSPHAVLRNGFNANSHEVTGGIETFQWGVVDTHFSERARETRLIRLLAQTDVRFGFGVDETTALSTVLVQEEGKADKVVMTVVGAGGVYIVDMSSSHVLAETPFEVRDVVTHYLNAGDSFIYYPEADDFEIIYASGSSVVALDTDEENVVTSDEIFKDTAYKDMVAEMLSQGASTAMGASKESDPTYEVIIETTDSAMAVSNNGRISYSNMSVKILVQTVAP